MSGKQDSSSSSPVISIFAPVYNDEAGVEELATRIAEAARKLDESIEVLIVNDGGTATTLAMPISESTLELRIVTSLEKLVRCQRSRQALTVPGGKPITGLPRS